MRSPGCTVMRAGSVSLTPPQQPTSNAFTGLCPTIFQVAPPMGRKTRSCAVLTPVRLLPSAMPYAVITPSDGTSYEDDPSSAAWKNVHCVEEVQLPPDAVGASGV